ncbi:MAG: rRNA (adenine-N6)-dimethyltransferase [Halanaerobiales bacterium]|nr:rRNA (adenine-N6)-dimethyltransferase [Halanaerobiales bacterium]
MKIDNLILQQYKTYQDARKLEKQSWSGKGSKDEQLKELCNEFTAIFLKQMFKAMRGTVPESGFIDGGFSEDIFTDMLDTEISKIGSNQQGMNSLSRVLYQELKSKEPHSIDR